MLSKQGKAGFKESSEEREGQSLEAYLNSFLRAAKDNNLWREFRQIGSAQGAEVQIEGRKLVCFCSNNYLNLASDPCLAEKARDVMDRLGFGSGASRYISGNFELYAELERSIARFKEKAAALVFPTGYQANVGTVSTLCLRDDIIFSDELNHASLIDGMRLSKAKVVVYPHRDIDFLEAALKREKGRKWVITDGIFSMDGDAAPLQELVGLKEKYGFFLYVDDAHGTGVLGKQGQGYIHELGVQEGVDVVMGTFSKALGSLGGFVAASNKVIDYLRNYCRSLIYTTALPAPVLAYNLAGLEVVRQKESERQHIRMLTHKAYQALRDKGYACPEPVSAILPVVIGESEAALAMAQSLYGKGLFIPAIRPPTVKKGTARLRIAFMSAHTEAQLHRLLEAL